MSIRRFLFSTVLLIALLFSQNSLGRDTVHAQTTHAPTLHIIDVDTTQFPQLALTIGGANWPAPLATLPVALTLDDHQLPINHDQTDQHGIQLALAVDVNQLVTRNDAGQSGFVEMTGTLLDLVEANGFVRNQDWLAGYQLQGDNKPRLIQNWTQEPNLFFNGVVSNRPAEINDTPFTALALIDVIERMADLSEAATLPKVLFLFSTGAGLPDLSSVLDAATQKAVAIHVVELLGSASATPSETLQSLATQSGGHYTALASPDDSTAVVEALAAARTVRVLHARADSATPQSLTVSVTLPDETSLEASTHSAFADLTIAPMTISLVEPAAEVQWETLVAAAAGDPNVRQLPIRANFNWPDGHERELLQVSYTLRGPGAFAQQEIRTETPFDQATLSLNNLENGAYTLEIRALDELGLEAEATNAALQFNNLPTFTESPAGQGRAAGTGDEPSQSTAEAQTNGAAAAVEAGSAAPALVQQAGNNAQPSETVQLPGLPLAIPRTLLIWLLPVLLLLIGYLIYSERRERRRQREDESPFAEAPFLAEPKNNPLYNLRGEPSKARANHHYDLDGAKENPTQRYALHADDDAADERVAPDNADKGRREKVPAPLFDSAAQRGGVQQAVAAWQTNQNAPDFADETALEEEITDRPAHLEDEEATYRTQEVAQPIIGYLIRTTSDPNLPKELPIYGLRPASGALRQIYIGRHSQHNTIVINDKRISREHAVIIQRDGRLYLRDNASTAGTFLNWKRLTPGEELLLRHNDLISFGQIVYEFHLGSEDEATVING
ncbi:MAG: FHA domain-containing protein [Caldilineaceae bacterium]